MDLSPGAASRSHDLPGVLCGRFELLREEPATIGVQLFGPTVAVLDRHSGEPARACLLDAALLPTAEARAEFVRALGEFAELSDPALVPQVFVGEDGERVVVCYDPLQGAYALRDMDDGPGSADLAHELQRLGRQLARALAALHGRNRVHGMLAGEAVLIGPRGAAAFQHGFAPLCARDELERRWRALDTAVLAPELLAGGPFTPAADTYAWGVILAEFATGQRGAAVLRAAEPAGLPSGLWALIGNCLAGDPDARPRDGAELLRWLESLALGGAGDSLTGAVESASSGAKSLSERLASESVPGDSPAAPAPPPPVLSSLGQLLGERARRPPTVPPTLASAAALSAVPGPGAGAALDAPGADAPPAASTSDVAARLAVADSGEGRAPGRSASGLRKIHVLTEDAIVRPGRIPCARGPDAHADTSGADRSADPLSPAEVSAVEAALADGSAPESAGLPPPPAAESAAAPTRAAETSTPVRAGPPVAPPPSSDRAFWIILAVLVLAVVLAFALT